ncbi:3-oxoacyl-ACP synthase [Streptomyces sp. NBC_01275]|uniref:beta-ketoacyl synthase N-terminal-like domain-containing protein n=1 Tax=Streptomyces sp. NBC_01275 TaxID=2903807 RepID=UPI00225491AD|nr:beta-ketoacyl synthase N-terminal-like domain-containing protein [Streptomyces sp. NBC_01275]MCX4763941.1 3-oxoacyl-ACP synthase [Streptomyces sp. NBC_01275]
MNARSSVAESLVMASGLVSSPPGTVDDTWFDHRVRLGPRGYKYLPPACQYLLCAAREALSRTGGEAERHPQERRGVVVGTNCAVSALHADIEETVRDQGIERLSPMITPFFSVNLVASRLSTEHRFKGFNVTVTSPRTAGIEALHIASQELAAGRGDLVLAGVTEAADPRPNTAEPESGAAVLALRPLGAAHAGGDAVLRTALRFIPPTALESEAGRRRAEDTVRTALDELCASAPAPSGARPASVTLVIDDSPVAGAVAAAVRGRLGPRASVSTAFPAARAGALAPVEVLLSRSDAEDLGPRLVVVAAREGNVALGSISTRPGGDARGAS